VRTTDGKIDLAHTRACAPPWSDFAVVVNGNDWKDGIVTAAEKAEVVRQAREALLNAIDPETGRHIVVATWRPEDLVGMGIGGPAGGDLYLDFLPGYYPSASAAKEITSATDAMRGAGVHGFFPQRRSMQAIFYLGGPGVAQGKKIPGVRVCDIAPTICRLMGIPVPADATGHVVGEALAR